MKKWLTAAFMAAVLTVGVVPALAAGPALVIQETGCGMLASDGTHLGPFDFHAVVVQIKENQYNVTLTCRGQQPDSIPAPSTALVRNYGVLPEECHTPFGATTNWTQVITPSGEMTLSCRVNASGR